MDRLLYNQDSYFKICPVFFLLKNKELQSPKNFKVPRHLDYGDVVIDTHTLSVLPRSETCRANLNNNLSYCFKSIRTYCDKDSVLDFSLFAVCPENTHKYPARFNVYSKSKAEIVVPPGCTKIFADNGIRVNPASKQCSFACTSPEITVQILDIVVGNTCVLLDRDESNIERRQFIGKAGEYDLENGDLIYFTLSNFWIQNQHISSFVLGMIRFVMNLVGQSTPQNDFAGHLLKLVNQEDIIKAINTNDFELAKSNFDKISQFICDISANNVAQYPLNSTTIDSFNYLIKVGYKHFVPDSWTHWTTAHREGHGQGAESFLFYIVKKEMLDKREPLKHISLQEIWNKYI